MTTRASETLEEDAGVESAVREYLDHVSRTPKATVKGMPPLVRPPAPVPDPESADE